MKGTEWNAQSNQNVNSILNYDKYNGRINILDNPNPDLRFQMVERIAIQNKSSEYRDAVAGIFETNALSSAYFSVENIQILQNGLRAGVYALSKDKLVIPPQNIDNLKIIMRSIYLQYSRYSTVEPISQQIAKLNQIVLDYAVPSVYQEAVGYLNYCRDQSTLVVPLELPLTTDRDYKPLEWKHF